MPAERGWGGGAVGGPPAAPRAGVWRLGVGSGSRPALSRGESRVREDSCGATTTGEAPALCSALGRLAGSSEPTGPCGVPGGQERLGCSRFTPHTATLGVRSLQKMFLRDQISEFSAKMFRGVYAELSE